MAEEPTIEKALFDATCAMENPKLDSVGQAGKRRYKYASLGAVYEVVKRPLQERGLTLLQRIEWNGESGGYELKTSIAKGEVIIHLDSRPIDLDCSPQDQGSRETYAKRYALCTVFGLYGQEDDDAQGQQRVPSGQFTAKCRACGRRFTFESREQYEGYLASMKDPKNRCCPSPDWAVE